jgi:drug/metabolite transporter (DMT)-like permease
MTKEALSEIPPFTLLVVQMATSVFVLWVATLASRARFRLNRRARNAAATGVLEPGLAYAVGVPGLALTSAANASVISAAEPALILLLAWLLLKQPPKASTTIAIVVAMAGLVMVAAPDIGEAGPGDLRGDFLILLGTLFAAGYVVLSSRYVVEITPLPLAAMQQTVGLAVATVVLGAASLAGSERVPTSISHTNLLIAMASGVVQYALAFWFYLVGLKTLAPSTAGLFLALTPVFGVTGAIVFLGESIVLLQAIGSVFVIGAVFLAARR